MANRPALPGPARRRVQSAQRTNVLQAERRKARRKRLDALEMSGRAKCAECGTFQETGFATCEHCGAQNPGRTVTLTGLFCIQVDGIGSTVLDLESYTCRADEVPKVLCVEMGKAIARIRRARRESSDKSATGGLTAPLSKARTEKLLAGDDSDD